MSVNKKHGLGRGLEALLGEDDLNFNLDNINTEELTGATIRTIEVEKLVPSTYQPRKDFNQEALNSLVNSIKEKGVLQPLLIRKKDDEFEIIAGERRWRAAKLAGLKEVPVIEKEMDNQGVLEVALVENLLRENLSAIEEAEGFSRLISEFHHSQEELSQIVGKSRSYVTNILRLLNLPLIVQGMIKNGDLSVGHARTLVGLENAEELAKKIIEKGLNVRQTEDLVNNLKNFGNKQRQSFKKDPSLKEIEKNLTHSIGMKVKINGKNENKGKITIEYQNPAELNTLLSLLDRK